MREILFRGKRVDNGEWIEGGYAENGGKTFIIVRTRYIPDTRDWDTVEYYENNPCYHLSMIEVDPETVCQYTGLTDKNGRKIFEGDIVRYTDEVIGKGKADEIKYNETHAAFCRLHKSEMGLQYLFIDEAIANTIEVIGNIFDNPDLIGE